MDFTPAEIGILYLAWYVWGAIYVVAMAAWGAAYGVQPLEITLGFGPKLIRIPIRDFQVSLALIFFGSSVRFPSPHEVDRNGKPWERTLDALPWLARVGLHTIGPAMCGILGLGIFAITNEKIFHAIALIGLFNGSFNFLPLFPLSGFAILVEFVRLLCGRNLIEMLPDVVLLGSALVVFTGTGALIFVLLYRYDHLHHAAESLLAAVGVG